LFKPDGIPRDVIVDHLRAELKINSLSRCLRGYQYLGTLTELTLRIDTAAGRITVADLHPSMYLRNSKPPLAQLSERSILTTVASQKVERILMLGEDEELFLSV